MTALMSGELLVLSKTNLEKALKWFPLLQERLLREKKVSTTKGSFASDAKSFSNRTGGKYFHLFTVLDIELKSSLITTASQEADMNYLMSLKTNKKSFTRFDTETDDSHQTKRYKI